MPDVDMSRRHGSNEGAQRVPFATPTAHSGGAPAQCGGPRNLWCRLCIPRQVPTQTRVAEDGVDDAVVLS